MDNKKEHFRANYEQNEERIFEMFKWFFSPFGIPLREGEKEEAQQQIFKHLTMRQISTRTHIFRVECARSKREKPRSFKKKIEKVCYDHVFIQCSTSYLSLPLCVYVPLSIPPCKHFKRQIITRTYIVDKQRCIFSTHQRHSQFFF